MQAFFEYWCPATNTLHTFVGEISITLWDLCRIGGLPLYGSFYDEVVPSAKEMSSLPSSCEYLFAAFHHLSLELGGPHSVTATEWVGFWFHVSKNSQQTVFEEIGEGKVIPQSARDDYNS